MSWEQVDLDGFANDYAIIGVAQHYPTAVKAFKKFGQEYFVHTDPMVLGKIFFDSFDEQQVNILFEAAQEVKRRVDANTYWIGD
jgi:coproporphyrinogen III oxidase